MAALVGGPIQVAGYLCTLRGGSQPVLVEATNGVLYVLKFRNNLQGRNVIFNEAAGAELFRACGLGVPPWEPLMVTEDFLDRNRRCWLQARGELIRPESGLSFGSRYQGSLKRRLLVRLPGAYYSRVRNRKSFWLAWLIDVCCDHVDTRQAVFLEDRDRALDALFVDSGHLFGGPSGGEQPPPLTSAYFDGRIYPDITLDEAESLLHGVRAVDADGLWKRVRAFPDDWQTASAIQCFSRGLDRLMNRALVRSTIDSLFENLRRLQSRTRPTISRWNDQRSASVFSNIVRAE